MIRVIEKNQSVLLGTCPSCLSKFTLEDEDIIYLYLHSDTKGVHCPVCFSEVLTCDIQKVSNREVEKLLKGEPNNE